LIYSLLANLLENSSLNELWSQNLLHIQVTFWRLFQHQIRVIPNDNSVKTRNKNEKYCARLLFPKKNLFKDDFPVKQ
jgi:hypothetical protein